LVEERLREVGSRVAPVNDAVRGLKELCDFIRADQPPLADAEQLRDSLISRMFDDLGRQGLDANHPFAAYGDKEEAPRPGRLKSLLSLGRTPSVDKAPRGGDLRDMVRHMIEEARRIPEPPPLPVDYGPLLEELRRWVEAAEAANRDVDAATQVRRPPPRSPLAATLGPVCWPGSGGLCALVCGMRRSAYHAAEW
jgi:hypothetical protein